MPKPPHREEDEIILRERAIRRLAEERIQEAMAKGAFDNLPGKGRPLDLRENPFVPPELRLAYKLLKDANFAPDWIELDRDVRATRDELAAFQQRHLDWLRRQAQSQNGRTPAAVLEWHRRMRAELMRRIDELNRKIDQLNLIVPQLELQRPRLDPNYVLGRFDQQCAAAYPPLAAPSEETGTAH
ncbi:MAG TPA: DnaJ family domain-containing protein [Limnochordales bacterium]